MSKVIDEIKDDVDFIKSHTLQPQWYKVFKVFMILGFLLGYYFLFGWLKTVIFFASFFTLAFVVHIVYRVKTEKWTRSWLDFEVIEVDGEVKADRIGKFYYTAIAINVLISLVTSQVFGR